MGLYDTFGPEHIQIKAGPCEMRHYNVGDEATSYVDGIYVAYEGIVVIQNRVVVGVFKTEQVFDKWGGELSLKQSLDSGNHIIKAIKETLDTQKEKEAK